MVVKIERQIVYSETRASGATSPTSPADRVAGYFRSLANRGLGCASNNGTIAVMLGLSVESVREAKRQLIVSKRLSGKWGKWLAIDGQQFGMGVVNEIEDLKTILRRHYPLVCDARTVDAPTHSATGSPAVIVIGDRRITLVEAVALAHELTTESDRRKS